MHHFMCPHSPGEQEWIDSLKKELASMKAEHANWKSELLALHESQESRSLRIGEICKLLNKLDLEIARVERQIEAFYSQQVRLTTEC